jgi:hypothetical protein
MHKYEEEYEEYQETGVWSSFKSGLQVGAGFFIGYFLMRFTTIIVMIAVGLWAIMAVCVPKAEQLDREVIAPIENKINFKFVNNEEVVWPSGCRVRAKPTKRSKILGYVKPGHRYPVLRKKGRWTKIGGFTNRGWVGCKAYPPGSEATLEKI